MKTQIVTLENKKVKEMDLPEDLFAQEIKPHILNEMVLWQRAKMRAGNQSTKTVSEVSGTGKKPHAQKGTGRARAGSKRRIQDVGGATYGPKSRSFEIKMPKKVRQLALKIALSSKAQENKLLVLDDAKLKTNKTKDFSQILKKLGVESALFIDGSQLDNKLLLASRNLHKIAVLPQQGANVLDILNHDQLVMTQAAIEQLSERLQ